MVFPFKSHRSTRLHNLLRTQSGQPAPHCSSRAASAGAPHPGRASASQPHSPHRQAPQTLTLQRQIPAGSLLAPKPSNKTHWAVQGGFPVNSTCRTTLLYPNRSHPHWRCHLGAARSLDHQDRVFNFILQEGSPKKLKCALSPSLTRSSALLAPPQNRTGGAATPLHPPRAPGPSDHDPQPGSGGDHRGQGTGSSRGSELLQASRTPEPGMLPEATARARG